MLTVLRHKRKLDQARLLQTGKLLPVLIPDGKSCRRDLIRQLQLGVEIGRVQFAGQVAGSVVLPAVFVHLAAEILAPVRPLFPEDLRVLDVLFMGDEERAALSAAYVLGLMEAEAAEIPEGSQRPPLIFRQNALRRILHHEQVMPFCNIHDLVHLAAHPGVMNRNDSPGLLRDGVLDQLFIQVHGIRTDIHEHRSRPAQHKGVRRRYERIGRHDHLIPRPHPGK